MDLSIKIQVFSFLFNGPNAILTDLSFLFILNSKKGSEKNHYPNTKAIAWVGGTKN